MSASSDPNMNSASALRDERLTDAGGAEEDERSDRPSWILQSGARAAHGLRQRGDGFVLADDPLVQRLFHLQQPLGLLAREPRHRDASPHRHDLRDVLFGDVGVLPWHSCPVTTLRCSNQCASRSLRSRSRSSAASSNS